MAHTMRIRKGDLVHILSGKDRGKEGRVIDARPKDKKVIRRSIKFHAHDEQNSAHVGDIVRIVETRPLSKTKRWRLAEVLEVAK